MPGSSQAALLASRDRYEGSLGPHCSETEFSFPVYSLSPDFPQCELPLFLNAKDAPSVTKPLTVLMALLDKPEVGGGVIEDILQEVFRWAGRYRVSTTNLPFYASLEFDNLLGGISILPRSKTLCHATL